ncbi:hypothetical protein RDV84_11085 [Lysobacter yananisis]|uniref:DUF4879 domain-containing protein n=1 Tax=Lysobacter yananisis TaxID=1003114 RepID=A0ABY9PE69_9GAMM|nr:hypothetical protein [Lysobacter yananisis]WMT05358.1 hypothetical protein RDV84_11085 [Lysobacter yananisis]
MLGKKLKVLAAGLFALGVSASAHAALVQTVRHTTIWGFPAPHSRDVDVWCEPGEVATGGGYKTFDALDLYISKSAPISNNGVQGWGIRYTSAYPSPDSAIIATAYVVCLKQQ